MNLAFTNNAPHYMHEIWRDDGDGFALVTTLAAGLAAYTDAAGALTSDYKVRAVGYGDPSDFATAQGAQSPLGTDSGEQIQTDTGETIILDT